MVSIMRDRPLSLFLFVALFIVLGDCYRIKREHAVKKTKEPCNDNNECKHGGTCQVTYKDKLFCKCKKNIRGDRCDIIEGCKEFEPGCSNSGGNCLSNVANEEAYCDCPPNKSFNSQNTTCQVPCNNNDDCMHGGTCKIKHEDKLFCKCKKNINGDKCDVIEGCKEFEPGCSNSEGKCLYNVEEEKAYCDCPSNQSFDPKGQNCHECYCGQNSTACTFKENGEKLCTCDDGFFQNDTICALPCYNNDDCKHGGTCEAKYDEKLFCKCKKDVSGDKCDIVDGCKEFEPGCSKSGGKCLYNVESENAYCECPGNHFFNGKEQTCKECDCGQNSTACSFKENGEKLCTCQNGFFQNDSICALPCLINENCEHGGKCEAQYEGNSFCKCKRNLRGDKCEVITNCHNIEPWCTESEGKCMYNESDEEAYCACPKNKIFNTKLKKCQEPIVTSHRIMLVVCCLQGAISIFLLIALVYMCLKNSKR